MHPSEFMGRGKLNPKWRRWAACAGIAIAGAVGALLLSKASFFQFLTLRASDAQFALRGRLPTKDIVLLVADKKAFDAFPEVQIFWHPYYAQAIQAAGQAGARVIGLDLAFGVPVEKWEPDYDRLLAEAVSTSPIPVVCGYVPDINKDYQALPVPINMMAAALGLSGFANMTADPDDFIRRQELIEAPPQNPGDRPPARSLAMRIAEKYVGEEAKFRNGLLWLRGHEIPIAPDRSIFINFAGPPGTFPRVSLADFIAAARAGNSKQLRAWVKDKIVLIGTDSIADRFPTPFYMAWREPLWTTAGVEIHANTLRTILEQRYLQPVPELWRVAGLLAASSIATALVVGLAALRAGGGFMLEALGIVGFTQILFRQGQMLSSAELLIAAILSAAGSVVYRFATAEERRDFFLRAVSLFVGPQVSRALEETHSIGRTGKRETVTILFTDIRGFTAFTEKTSQEDGPEVVVQLLNDYLTMMVSLIVVFKGHVNKFIGDGILAVFSDADTGAVPGDHALRAVKCATRLVTAPSRFETGAGIHTGVVVIGNVGSAEKMEYTVLGDPVNLASRLESLNKEHKTRLLMSEATRALLPEGFDTTLIGTVTVRGKSEPLKIYSVPSTRVSVKAVAAVENA